MNHWNVLATFEDMYGLRSDRRVSRAAPRSPTSVAVPGPASAGLLGFGVSVLAAGRRRRLRQFARRT
jgi:hypothetical protein